MDECNGNCQMMIDIRTAGIIGLIVVSGAIIGLLLGLVTASLI